MSNPGKDKVEKTIDQILNRGILVNFFPSKEEFRTRLQSGQKLRFYIGADPTSTALHLSHAKNYMLLEEFRLLGHEVFVLFGDFTARIGDPTDRSLARKQLTREDVLENVHGWINQIRPLMDFDAKINPPKIVYNNDWLSRLTMEDVINLASHTTVQRMLERDMFEKRMKENKPIFLHEFLYPLMQGYDSVALNVDVELCGTDQIFNALMGRTLQKQYNDKCKFVIAVHLMENPTTGELMSKSRGTGVFLNSTPFDMYGSIMAQPDEMTRIFFVCNTRIPIEEIDRIMEEKSPRDAKMRVAFKITKIFHGEQSANKAQEKFIKLVQKKEYDLDDLIEVCVELDSPDLFSILRHLLDDSSSNSLIRRLISQGAVKVDGKKCTDATQIFYLNEPTVIAVGKKKWFKIVK
jgi:tyrosyl-tRNA synthetase